MGWTRPIRRTVRLRRRPDVETLEVRTLLSTTLPNGNTDFTSIIGAAQTRSTYGVNGSGMSVAVIDTGINYNNAAFGGGGFGPGHKVVAGYDFADNSPDPSAVQQHGTAVAGLIASDSPSDPGVAPGADIVDLRVFNQAGVSSFNAVASALQWVINNHQQYNITAVNISLADGSNLERNWYGQDGGVGQQVTSLIGQLDALNIPVITATGNSFHGQQGQAFPSIVPDTISVTGTDASDQIVSDAQRLGTAAGLQYATDLAAPSKGLTAPAEGNSLATVEGTSFAAPLVTGAVVLLQQIYEQRFGHLPTVSDLDHWLQQGANSIQDSVTGITIGRLNIPGAAALIPGAPSTGNANNATPAQNTPPPAPTPTPPAPTTNPTPAPQPQVQPQAPTTPAPAPAPSNPPDTSTTPNQPTTPPAAAPGVKVSVNGQVVDGTSGSASGSFSSLVALFAKFFGGTSSSRGGDNSASPVQTVSIWGVSTGTPTSPKPAGTVHVSTQHPAAGHHRGRWRHS